MWEKWIIADLPMQSVVLPPEGHIKRERTLFCKHGTCRSVIALPGISLPFTDVQISFIQRSHVWSELCFPDQKYTSA